MQKGPVSLGNGGLSQAPKQHQQQQSAAAARRDARTLTPQQQEQILLLPRTHRHLHAAGGAAADGDVEEDHGVGHDAYGLGVGLLFVCALLLWGKAGGSAAAAK